MAEWQQIISEHAEAVWRTVCRLTAGVDARACFGKVFLRAYREAGRDSVSDWRMVTQRCAVAEALEVVRARGGELPQTPAGELRRYVAALTEQQGLLFCLRYLSEFSYAEIAMELRMPLDSVGSSVNGVGMKLGRQLLARWPAPVGDDVAAPPAELADDALEEAVSGVRETEVGPLPMELVAEVTELVLSQPEISFDKPEVVSPIWPVMIGVLLLALLGGGVWVYLASRPTPPLFGFAEVVEAMGKAKSADYHMIRTMQLPDSRTKKLESRILEVAGGKMRQEMEPQGEVVIWDMGAGKALTLEDFKKRATLRDAADMFEETRPVSAMQVMRELTPAAGVAQEKTKLDGRAVQAFAVAGAEGQSMKIWAEESSHLPLIVEMSMPKAKMPATVLLSGFVWNREVDPSALSLETPEGYELSAIKVNLKPATEEDLVKALGVAARMNGGRFPDQFSRAGMAQIIAKVQQALPADKQTPEFRKASEDLDADLLQLGRGWLFVAEEGNGDEWTYCGAGAYLGSASPVLWYRPTGVKHYRLVDASLMVRQSPGSKLPAGPATRLAQPTTRGVMR